MSVRSLPRIFLPEVTADGPIELPKAELDKLRHVLRLSAGAQIAILPNDGSVIRCELRGKEAIPIEVSKPASEPILDLTLAQSLPKGDKLDDIVKACTGIGVNRFVLFESERTVVRWDAKKREDRLRRMEAVVREEAEVTFRTRLPKVEFGEGLKHVLERFPDASVLSEVEGLPRPLRRTGNSMTIVVGPEGGWNQKELELIADRGVTLGPRVLRVEHAGAAAAAVLLLS